MKRQNPPFKQRVSSNKKKGTTPVEITDPNSPKKITVREYK